MNEFVKREMFSGNYIIRWTVGHNPIEDWWEAEFYTQEIGGSRAGFQVSVWQENFGSFIANKKQINPLPRPTVKANSESMVYLDDLIRELTAFKSEIYRQTGQQNLVA